MSFSVACEIRTMKERIIRMKPKRFVCNLLLIAVFLLAGCEAKETDSAKTYTVFEEAWAALIVDQSKPIETLDAGFFKNFFSSNAHASSEAALPQFDRAEMEAFADLLRSCDLSFDACEEMTDPWNDENVFYVINTEQEDSLHIFVYRNGYVCVGFSGMNYRSTRPVDFSLFEPFLPD